MKKIVFYFLQTVWKSLVCFVHLQPKVAKSANMTHENKSLWTRSKGYKKRGFFADFRFRDMGSMLLNFEFFLFLHYFQGFLHLSSIQFKLFDTHINFKENNLWFIFALFANFEFKWAWNGAFFPSVFLFTFSFLEALSVLENFEPLVLIIVYWMFLLISLLFLIHTFFIHNSQLFIAFHFQLPLPPRSIYFFKLPISFLLSFLLSLYLSLLPLSRDPFASQRGIKLKWKFCPRGKSIHLYPGLRWVSV